MRWLSACLIVCASCGGTRQRWDESYRTALRQFREGNTSAALSLARTTEPRCPQASECRWTLRLLEAEILLAERQLDAAASILSGTVPEGSRFAALRARQLMLQGGLEVTRGHLEAAGEFLRRAQELAAAAGAPGVVMDAEQWEGQRLFFSQRADQAGEVFRRERARAAALHDPYYEALASNGLGMIRLRQSRYDEAIPWFQQMMEAAGRGGAHKLTQAAGLNLGICYARLGNFDAAIQALRQALDRMGAGGLTTYRMNILGELGSTYLLQREPRKAMPYYQQAAALARTPDDKARWFGNLSSALADTGDYDAAERSNEEAARYAPNAESRAFVKQHAAFIAAGRGHYDEARELYHDAIELAGKDAPVVLWESHAGLAEVYSKVRDYRRAGQEFARTLDIIDQNVAKLSSADYKLTFFARLIGFYQNYVGALMAQKDYRKALEVADSSRARILFQRLALKGTASSAARDYPAIARQLDTVLLFYWLAPEQSYLWVVTPSRAWPPLVLPPAGQIEQWVDQYRAFIERRIGDPIAVPNEAGRRLYESLIAPAARLIPRGSRVVLLPDGALHWLNFETLPVYGPAGETPHYWIEDVRPVVAPSLSVLAESKPARPRAPDSVLIIGNPVSPGAEFPALTYASAEIAAIEKELPGAKKQAFVGAAARPAVYQEARPDRFSLLHFSAHAVANEQSPLDSAIILSPERDNFKLYARNIMAVPLRAGLVTISACRSAGARSYSGEGLVGFAWAFLQAGARNVIAGLWDVTDSSTPAIMEVLYAGMAKGRSPADALRESKLRLIRSGQAFRKPYYWGPFQIYVR